MRGYSGVSYRGYEADIDRVWVIGKPTDAVRDLYRMTWECNRAMAEAIRPGVTCADVFAAGARVEARWGWPSRGTGRTGHGFRNTGGLSVHPDNSTVLEPGMVISVEPMFPTVHGFFDLEDQYVVTEAGAECLHEPAPEDVPVVAA
jgi:Xaa-Pro aminopeptidase